MEGYINSFILKRKAKILILGLSNSGKTTLLYKLKLNEIVSAIPTIGFNVETVTYKNIDLELWDLGGNSNIISLWKHYYEKVNGIIYLIESTENSVKESSEILKNVLSNESISEVPLLVLANKQDLSDSISIPEIADGLKIHEVRNRKWFIQSASVLNGMGIYEGLDWICSQSEIRNQVTFPVFDVLIKFFLSFVQGIVKYFASLWRKKYRKNFRLLILGPANTGKTVILYKLKLGEVVRAIPTIGFNVEEVDYQDISFTIWDVGGQEKIRPLWRHYYKNTDGLVFVIDSTYKNIEEARDILKNVLADDEISNVPLLILANKQDQPNSMTTQEIFERMNLNQISNKKFHLQNASGFTGDGLIEGLDWLYKILIN
jgi:small GTP-binding protein